MTKTYLVMVLVLIVVVMATIVNIDVVHQEAHDHRWAVSHIFSLVPDVDNGWRLYFFGHQYTLQPEQTFEKAETIAAWFSEQAHRAIEWVVDMKSGT